MTQLAMAPHQVLPALGRRVLVDGYHLVLDLERSAGSWIHDARDGKAYLDFFNFFASNPLGMNHPDMTDPRFLEQLGRVAVNKVSNADFYTRVYAEFVEAMDRVARPEPMRYFFFIDGGALAVENALKAAFDWKVRRNLRGNGGKELGHQVLHLEWAFHGRSGYTLSLTNTADPRKTIYFPKFDWPRIPSPAIRFPLDEAEGQRLDRIEGESLEQARRHFEERQGDIAAIIIEPIQGEGGDRHFRPSFLRGLRALADEYEALLIFDEVQTGVGMTGRFWAFEHYDVRPDVIAFAKKLQVGGIMAGPRMDEEPENVFRVPSRINSTWGAHIVDMFRATRMLEVIERDGLVDNARHMGERLLAGLKELEQTAGGLIDNVRGRGLMCAFDLPDEHARDLTVKACMDAGLLVPPCGTRSVRFRPPLTVDVSEIDEGLDRMEAALVKVKKDRPAPGPVC
jgi:L-lysine 6-transaminase